MRTTLAALLVLAGCSSGDSGWTPVEDTSIMVDIAGTYDYESSIFGLRGTITFEQDVGLVSVINVTYANANDRPLVGEGVIEGNRLDIVLRPENGDRNFTAAVTFLFRPDGDEFAVAFSDTNGDQGDMGSYRGRRRK